MSLLLEHKKMVVMVTQFSHQPHSDDLSWNETIISKHFPSGVLGKASGGVPHHPSPDVDRMDSHRKVLTFPRCH
jgi:hypothetical protein